MVNAAPQQHRSDPLAPPRPPVTDLVRQRLLAGEALTNVQIQQEYNRKGHVIKDVVDSLINEGYRFTRTKVHRNVGQTPPVFDVVWQLDTSTPEQETASAAIRRRLLAGETLDAAQVAEEYGVSRSLLSVVKGQMTKPKPKKKKKAPKKTPDTRSTPQFTPAMEAVAEQLLAGERLDPKTVQARHGVNLKVVLTDLERKGYLVKRTSAKREDGGGWVSLYRLDLPWLSAKTPAWVDEANGMPDLPVASKELVPSTPKPKQATIPEVPDLPPLGTQVIIVLHSLDPDTGEYTVGMRNGRESWLVPWPSR